MLVDAVAAPAAGVSGGGLSNGHPVGSLAGTRAGPRSRWTGVRSGSDSIFSRYLDI